MKKLLIILTLGLLFNIPLSGQQDNGHKKQFGLTGLAIIYPNANSGLGVSGIRGYAFYLNAGKFISPRISIGLKPFFGSVDDGWDVFNQKINSLGLNAYSRYHIPIGKSYLFADLSTGFGRLWYNSKDDSYSQQLKDSNGTMFNYSLGLGSDIHISNGWHFEILVQYSRMRNISNPENTSIGKTIIPSIGVQRFF